MLLAIASYSPEDPSFNYTGANTNTQNLVGSAGAYLADFLLFVWLDGLSATHGADLRGAATTQAARHQTRRAGDWCALQRLDRVPAVFLRAHVSAQLFRIRCRLARAVYWAWPWAPGELVFSALSD